MAYHVDLLMKASVWVLLCIFRVVTNPNKVKLQGDVIS